MEIVGLSDKCQHFTYAGLHVSKSLNFRTENVQLTYSEVNEEQKD